MYLLLQEGFYKVHRIVMNSTLEIITSPYMEKSSIFCIEIFHLWKSLYIERKKSTRYDTYFSIEFGNVCVL